MGAIPWVMASILVLILLLIVVVLMVNKKHKRPMDYYNLFIMGMIWTVIGIPFENSVLTILGLAFMLSGLVHKKEWKKNTKTWKKLDKKERMIVMWITIILLAVLILGFLALFLTKGSCF
jgi:formate hydrogenlyase subunit 3/multisubunit Na+/H+ antiporter MnhD subunit